jgi:arginyl-tRNA synthetase
MEKRGERIMIEYGQPNTHKEFHVGHLRNMCLGLSVVRLCQAAGFDVVPVSYIGDIGAHVAKCLWAYKKFHANETISENRGKFLGAVYAEATRYIEENPEAKEDVAALQRMLEAGDEELTALWKETRQWSIDEFAEIFKELGADFERIYFESEVEEAGKKLVHELVRDGIGKEGERGALIVDLEKEGLGVFLILKSDGAALYSTKELALAKKKFAEFDVVRSIHVVDSRQSLYFQQFFATLKRMGFDKEMTHLGYEFVTLAEGAMSSRKGNIVSYEDFRDEVVQRATEETRKRRMDWDDAKVNATAWNIAESAMKFGMLKQDTDRPIVFDIDAALAFEGFTGPYIQYAHARLCSILTKAGSPMHVSVMQDIPDGADDAGEFAALSVAAQFPDAVQAAAAAYKPSLLAQYLFDLAQAANGFYRDVPVASAVGQERERRLAIVRVLQITLKKGLRLLGIHAPEEM